MTILDELSKKEVWEDFAVQKTERGQLNRQEIKDLKIFIDNEEYLAVTESFSFGLPRKMIISKMDSDKKRTVYSYNREETWVLKLLAYLLYRYDGKLSDNCYSFRKHSTSKKAFDSILKIKDLDEAYVLKADIHDYFNSIDTDILLDVLRDVVDDDRKLLELFEKLLKQDACIYDGEVITEKRGAMAGIPLASFFANFYLLSLDRIFENRGIPYYRYSDDIIIFCPDSKTRDEAFGILKDETERKKLTLNEKKTAFFGPHEKWEFLGFSYCNGTIDLSEGTIRKMKGKIRRKAHSIYRWRKRKNISFERAARTMIRSFDYRFYDLSGDHDFTWTRFYFPVINSSEGLAVIDDHMEMYLRYLYSGRHYKGNYRVAYDDLKKLGYTPLVNEYYHWKKDNRILKKKNSDQ